MNQDNAKKIFLQALPELSEPLKSAVEFTLANWHKINRESRPSDVAINFFASLPALPTNEIDLIFATKLNEMAKILRDSPAVWLSLENLPHEQWRDVIGYEGLYQVSNYGRVKSFHNNDLPQLLRINPNKSGYATVALSKNGEMKSRSVHIIVAEAFIPNPKNLPVVHHIDDTKSNSCIWNLAWVTYSENTKLAHRAGKIKCVNYNRKFTPKEVMYIRKNYIPRHPKFGIKAMAKTFKVHKTTISDIIHYVTYKNIG